MEISKFELEHFLTDQAARLEWTSSVSRQNQMQKLMYKILSLPQKEYEKIALVIESMVEKSNTQENKGEPAGSANQKELLKELNQLR